MVERISPISQMSKCHVLRRRTEIKRNIEPQLVTRSEINQTKDKCCYQRKQHLEFSTLLPPVK